MKLALGTAQFGMAYGVANRAGQVASPMAASIMECARAHDIDTVDTAIGYGESEDVLGEAGLEGLRVITKLPEWTKGAHSVSEWVNRQIDGSLRRLRLDRLAGVLLHRPMQLLGAEGTELAAALQQLKSAGKVEKIGVSIYDPTELADIMAVCPIDLVQAPFNLIDRRLADSGWLDRLREAGVEVHVRSLFLQGLLLMTPDARPPQFARWSPIWQQWDNWLDRHRDVGAAAACLAFAQQHDAIDRLVVGVDSVSQLEELLAATSNNLQAPPPDIRSQDADLINPGLWNIN